MHVVDNNKIDEQGELAQTLNVDDEYVDLHGINDVFTFHYQFYTWLCNYSRQKY